MPGKVLASLIIISLALICYSIGVWTSHLGKKLKPLNLAFLWIGLVFDTTGTLLMTTMTGGNQAGAALHGVTGLAAILLMLFHAAWGTVGYVKKNERILASFKKFSVLVWIIWLVPFVSGMIMGMGK